MIYCVDYKMKDFSIADEIAIPYGFVGNMFKRIKENPDKRYNIKLNDTYPQQDVLNFMSDKNCVFACKDISIMKLLIKEGHKAYFDYPVSDWETYRKLKEMGVSDIYIDSSLCFSKSKLEKRGNLVVRVCPTSSPSARLLGQDYLESFFILPVHKKFYNFIDVFDFSGLAADVQETLLDIYKRESFIGPIGSLIQGLPADLPADLMPDSFAKKRVDCGQRCMAEPGTCKLCKLQLNLSKALYKLRN